MNHLFNSYHIKNMDLKNRVVMPPMCQYSVEKRDGIATDWHYVHYVSRAIGGAGLIIIEMTDVEPNGRTSDFDLGLWSDEQIPALARIVKACQSYGAKVAIQIAHAGRKAADEEIPVAPSAIPFDEQSKTPRALSTEEVQSMVQSFKEAVRRAVAAGFDAIELHGAHGYLLHQFQSSLTNQREDVYGKDLNKFPLEVIAAAKSVMPENMPLIMRISATEYLPGGYDVQECIQFSRAYQAAGVDVFHVSSGGEGPIAGFGKPGTHVAYQVPLARQIKEALNVPVIAVGQLDDAKLANAVIGNKDADLVAVGRGMLSNPNWTLQAAKVLKQEIEFPKQYVSVF